MGESGGQGLCLFNHTLQGNPLEDELEFHSPAVEVTRGLGE